MVLQRQVLIQIQIRKTEENWVRGDPVWARVALPHRVRGSALRAKRGLEELIWQMLTPPPLYAPPPGSAKLPSFTQPLKLLNVKSFTLT